MTIGTIVYCAIMVGYAEPRVTKGTVVANNVTICNTNGTQCDYAIEVEFENGDYITLYENDCMIKKTKENK